MKVSSHERLVHEMVASATSQRALVRCTLLSLSDCTDTVRFIRYVAAVSFQEVDAESEPGKGGQRHRFCALCPLGRGYLTGKIDESKIFADNDIRSRNPRFTPEAIRAHWDVVELLEKIAEEKGTTPAQIALAWLLAQKPWIVAIPGSRKLHRLDENIGAADIELTADDLSEIEDAISQITVDGTHIFRQPFSFTPA